jgi:hypothetical protein
MTAQHTQRPTPRPQTDALVGCLLDVSGSMHAALESGRGDKDAVQRLRAVLNAALKLAEAEQRRDPDASMFVGAFGLAQGNPSVVDLCRVVDSLVAGQEEGQDGHEMLIALANKHDKAHVSEYIRKKLSEHQARILCMHLQRHPERIAEFVDAIPAPQKMKNLRTTSIILGVVFGVATALPITIALARRLKESGLLHSIKIPSMSFMDFVVAEPRSPAEWLIRTGNAVPSPVDALVDMFVEILAPFVGGLVVYTVYLIVVFAAFAGLIICFAATGAMIGIFLGSKAGSTTGALVEDKAVENSKALELARSITKEWLYEFQGFKPQKVGVTISLLERLQDLEDHKKGGEVTKDKSLLDTLREHMYGSTPMRKALMESLDVFQRAGDAARRVLVVLSDGSSTDGDPLPIARMLQQEKVVIASVYLTDDNNISSRQLHDRPDADWNEGQTILFEMAHRVASLTHPIPVLASLGWKIPSSGESSLFASICSTAALEEFCLMLLSARFGSADALLDVVGRVRLDAYIDDHLVRTCDNPSNQERSSSCYAHATAAVLHMALHRIVGRKGLYPSIVEIRDAILAKFPPGDGGRSTKSVLRTAVKWYHPLRFREVNEEGARQAVLRRRPVLSTFHLSDLGWNTFINHFTNPVTRNNVLTHRDMDAYSSSPNVGGHAVVLTSCDPHSLTFLNSWGRDWGNQGSFSVENCATLELRGTDKFQVRFYDVYWLENDLTEEERKAYEAEIDEKLCAHVSEYSSIFELEYRCALCTVNSPIAKFKGNLYQTECPACHKTFEPEPGHLVQALYARAGLNIID